jgi:hypothetical protein
MKSILKIEPRIFFPTLFFILLFFSFSAYKMTNSTDQLLPRNQIIPLFDPHVASFICSPTQVPPLDAQADAWFRQALALESPEIYFDDRDYAKIVSLTRQAAERFHWKAMLNLASLYLEGRDPTHNTEDAITLVEQAMRLGAPAAYDRMGTYYMNGSGVNADATRAYAFWQLAAKMGNPETLTYLGSKLISVDDHPERSEWANEAVGTKMLECAYAQGYGLAAYELAFQYSIPSSHKPSRKEMSQALHILQQGVKFGCQKCAASLASEFSSMKNPAEMIAPFIDNARADRYWILSRALDFDPERRFPNLDKILPLPPSDLPPWNGDLDTLVNAARGVNYPPSVPSPPSASSERKDRFFLDPLYRLVPTEDITKEATAPFAGYWQRIIDDNYSKRNSAANLPGPALYQIGELFEQLDTMRRGQADDDASNLQWRNWRTVRHDQGTISAPVVTNRTRPITPPAKTTACDGSGRCMVTGTWQPWIHAEHTAQVTVNQYWRQTWLVEGQRFPDPKLEWMLDIAGADITWHLMDSTGVDLCPA